MTALPQSIRRRGFTLAEVMVAVSVLVCIILLVGQMVSGISVTTSNASKLSDSDNQARLIFSRMAADFTAIYSRSDVHFYFVSRAGNDAFYFYTQAAGHIDASDPAGSADTTLNGASLVGYRVSDAVSGGKRVELERLGIGLHWMDATGQNALSGRARSILPLPTLIQDAFSVALADPHNNSSNPPSSGSANWDVIGDQVFRMEFAFLLQDGTFATTPVLRGNGFKGNFGASAPPAATDDASAGYAPGSRWYDARGQAAYRCIQASVGAATWIPLGLQDVKAVVVDLVLLYPQARAVTPVGAVVRAAGVFPDFSGSVPVLSDWTQRAGNAATLRAAGLNVLAAGSVRVYERFFYLD
ncbi:MAG TPA: prepilin-type N-terminal cleavage/methylation domain-containing protein [Candidatus Methylacidiphilales bacterium]